VSLGYRLTSLHRKQWLGCLLKASGALSKQTSHTRLSHVVHSSSYEGDNDSSKTSCITLGPHYKATSRRMRKKKRTGLENEYDRNCIPQMQQNSGSFFKACWLA
jgi:hypothetical protein